MDKIKIKGINIFGFHGCMMEESKVGSNFLVDLEVELNLKKVSITDNIINGINYVVLYNIVKEENKLRSNLIENLAKRIFNRIKNEVKNIYKIKIKVCKLFPPFDDGGVVDKVCVIITS